MDRRHFLQVTGSTLLAAGAAGLNPALARAANWASISPEASGQGSALDQEPSVFRLAFGSCCEEYNDQPIWDVIGRVHPDAFVFLGDNIYGDTQDMTLLQAKYDRLASKPQFKNFRSKVPIFATWDDHDYGENDVGAEYPKKKESKEVFLNFFGEPKVSARRQREGIYDVKYFQQSGRRIQLILLDLRWFRTPLKLDERGHYIPNPSPEASLLGEEQWQWFEQTLREPADVRILASSTQLLARGHRWEKWENYPADRERFIRIVDELNIKNLVIISGDMHYGELSSERTPGGIDLFDLTSSGLTRFEPAYGLPNDNRLELFDWGNNFGLVSVRFDRGETLINLQVRDAQGVPMISRDLVF